MLFIAIGVIYFTIIFFYRNKLGANSKRRIKKKKELSPMISQFLFYEEEEVTKEEKSTYINLKIEIRELIKDKFHRQILSEILLDLQKDLSGSTKERLFKLYKDLGLHLDAFKKLKSWRWEIVSKGILELTKMEVDEAYGFIIKHVNDRRSVVRKQAEIAIVTLKKEGLNYFLDNTKHRISQWQQLKILDVVRNREDYKPPRFKAWLTSKNKDVVLFSLRLIKYYNQSDAKTPIIELVKHRNNQIKEEAIDCIKKFNITESLDVLKTIFKKSSVDIKLLVLDAMCDLGTESDIDFLKRIHKKEKNFNIKSKALNVINTIIPDTILPTEGIEEYGNKLDTLEKITVPKDFWDNKISDDKNSINEENNIDLEVSADVKEKEYFDFTLNNDKKDGDNILEDVEELINKEEVIVNEASEESVDAPNNNSEIDLIDNESDSLDLVLNDNDIKVLELDDEIYLPVFDEKDIMASSFLPVIIDFNQEIEEEVEDFLIIDFSLETIDSNNNLNETATKDLNNDDILEQEDYQSLFFAKDDYNKTLLLDTIEDAKNEKDIPLLKEILEKEKNRLIRGRAWEILKELSNEEIVYYRIEDKESSLEAYNIAFYSIFYQLFQVSDEACKLMLLDEILDLADEKEIAFLKTLENDSSIAVKRKAAATIKKIQNHNKKVKEEIIPEKDIDSILNEELKPLKSVNFNSNESLDHSKEVVFVPRGTIDITQEDKAFNIKDSKDLLPLEFCFVLEDLNIELPKPFSVFDIDFELNERKVEKQEKLQENTEEVPLPKEDKKEQSFLEQIISLSSKMRNKFNG